ncbi:hypothetical protein PYW08_006036 [Mythimna loreyi]|uniref:Uncharacterized protein n=1 Tax=Mythimna loreyi TaxID=667449 RepID=A0ACC2QNL4_9NEOP|nr:hypothetical protein PYW08_006036 [Mythimna loreyi]
MAGLSQKEISDFLHNWDDSEDGLDSSDSEAEDEVNYYRSAREIEQDLEDAILEEENNEIVGESLVFPVTSEDRNDEDPALLIGDDEISDPPLISDETQDKKEIMKKKVPRGFYEENVANVDGVDVSAIVWKDNKAEECKNNQKIIKTLELKVDYLERNLKAATIEIKNIPTSNPENKTTLTGIVQKLGSIINQPVPASDIKNIFRLRGKKETVGTVVVEFSTTSLKEQFIQSTKNYNKQHTGNRLNTSHLQATGPRKPIFVSEALTAVTKRLHYLTREFIKNSEYEQCWTANGKVYMSPENNKIRKFINLLGSL